MTVDSEVLEPIAELLAAQAKYDALSAGEPTVSADAIARAPFSAVALAVASRSTKRNQTLGDLLSKPSMVLLRQALYNLGDPGKKLVRIVESGGFTELLQQPYNSSAQQKRIRHARRLSSTQIAELVADYRAGAGSIYTLADKYDVHRNTVASVLKGQGVAIGKTAMNEQEVDPARMLLSDGLSWNAIGAKIGRDPKTVKKALEAPVS